MRPIAGRHRGLYLREFGLQTLPPVAGQASRQQPKARGLNSCCAQPPGAQAGAATLSHLRVFSLRIRPGKAKGALRAVAPMGFRDVLRPSIFASNWVFSLLIRY